MSGDYILTWGHDSEATAETEDARSDVGTWSVYLWKPSAHCQGVFRRDFCGALQQMKPGHPDLGSR